MLLVAIAEPWIHTGNKKSADQALEFMSTDLAANFELTLHRWQPDWSFSQFGWSLKTFLFGQLDQSTMWTTPPPTMENCALLTHLIPLSSLSTVFHYDDLFRKTASADTVCNTNCYLNWKQITCGLAISAIIFILLLATGWTPGQCSQNP